MSCINKKINSTHSEISLNIFKVKKPTAVIVIAGGTGIKQTFYESFAAWLTVQDFTVITFDYSGIGQSLNGRIRNVHGNLLDWARELDTVIHFAKQTYTEQQIILIGHSLGGQLIGFAKNALQCNKIILVAAQSGYWGFWKGFDKIKMFLTWHLLLPILTGINGYFPVKWVSKMENLPKKAALQWAKWCRSKHYFFAEMKNEDTFFISFHSNILSISIDDDDFAPKKAVGWLTSQFTNARTTIRHIKPGDYGLWSVGHFGFFKKTGEGTGFEVLKFIRE